MLCTNSKFLHMFLFSVVGLNFDFLGLNLTGFIAYSVFNIGLKYVKEVQVSIVKIVIILWFLVRYSKIYFFFFFKLEYHTVHPTGIIPVETNDVVFAVHAVFATAVTIFQCFIYEVSHLFFKGLFFFLYYCLLIFISFDLLL